MSAFLKKRYYAVYPYIWGVFPIVFLYSVNISEVSLSDIMLPLVISLFSVFVLLTVFNLFRRNNQELNSVIVTFIVFFNYSYIHFFNLLMHKINSEFIERNDKVLISGIIIFVLCLLLIWFYRKTLVKGGGVLYIVGVIILMFSIVNIFYHLANNYRIILRDKESISKSLPARNNPTKDTLRDIYYIIFDRLASQESLKRNYNIDISATVDNLQKKGFYIVKDSKCNYQQTDYSLASSLNMDYLQNINPVFNSDYSDKKILYEAIRNNEVVKILQSKGYRYYHLGSSWKPTSSNGNADYNYNIVSTGDFSLALFKTTFLCPVFIKFGYHISRMQVYDATLYQLNKLESLPQSEHPKFVFAHIMLPHPPYIFSSKGDYLSKDLEIPKEGYREEVRYFEKRITELTEILISKSKLKPIIVIQSDEGPYPERLEREDDRFDWNNMSDIEIFQKMSVFNAIYLPGRDTTGLYSSMSPVNTFRIIMNKYFNANYSLLKDEVYIVMNKAKPYRFKSYNEYRIKKYTIY